MPVSYSFATLFSGGGGTDIGLMAAGLTHAWSVEWDPAIAEVHRQNIDGTILIADVGAVDYRAVAPVDFLHASPSCINASQAKADAGEQPEDIHSAEAVVRALEAIGPRWFSLENVTMYRTFQSFRLITDALARAGYRMAVEHVNCADLGIPQTRRRLILRATKDRSIRGIRRTHCRAAKVSADLSLFGDDLLPWNGWYAAIEDLIPTLPETQFAPWQLQRLQNMPEGTFLHMTRNTQMENPTGTGIKMPFDPAGTVCASESQSARAFLIDGKATGEDYGPAPRVGTLPANTVTTYDRPSNVPKGLLVSNAKTEFGDGTRNSESPAFAVTTQHDGRLRALLVSRQTAGAGSPGAQRSCAPEPAHTVTHHPAGQTRAFLVDCQDSGSEVGLTIRDAADPTFTVSATMFRPQASEALAGLWPGSIDDPTLSRQVSKFPRHLPASGRPAACLQGDRECTSPSARHQDSGVACATRVKPNRAVPGPLDRKTDQMQPEPQRQLNLFDPPPAPPPAPTMIHPLPPFQRHSETSRQAAVSMHQPAKFIRQQVLEWFRANGPATDQELFAAMAPMPENTLRPRRCELRDQGLLEDTGDSKPSPSGRPSKIWKAK